MGQKADKLKESFIYELEELVTHLQEGRSHTATQEEHELREFVIGKLWEIEKRVEEGTTCSKEKNKNDKKVSEV